MDSITFWLSIVAAVFLGLGVTVTLSDVSSFEFWIARLCYSVAAAGLLFAYTSWLLRDAKKALSPNGRRWLYGVLAVFVVLLIGVGGNYWVSYREGRSLSKMWSDGSPNKESNSANYLFLDCLPLLGGVGIPVADNTYYVSGLFPQPNGFDMNMLHQVIGGAPRLPSSMEEMGGSSFRCVLSNYGDSALFSINLSPHAKFFKGVRVKTDSQFSIKIGEFHMERPWTMNIAKIDPGANNGFAFYLHSAFWDWTKLTFPPTVGAVVGNSNSRMEILLRVDFRQPLTFEPWCWQRGRQ